MPDRPAPPAIAGRFDCDALVAGGGAGGATFAYALARTGKSVVLVERGRPHPGERDERATLIEKRPYDDRPVEVNGTARRLYMGGVLGGGTSVFGGALLRPSRDDFHPGRHYARRLPRELWDWPVTYDDLEPYYTEAERLFGVAGADADDLGPLPKPAGGYPNRPLPLHPINERLMAAARARGLKPFRLPLAIDPGKCLRCGACAGFVCPTGARGSSPALLDRAAAAGTPVRVVTGAEVEALDRDGAGRVTGARLRDRATGRVTVVRARRYALAAGAIGTPVVLLRSGLGGPQVGRNYMPHLSPIVVGLFRGRTGAEDAFVKQVGLADFYFGTPAAPHKLGLVSSLPVPGPLITAKMMPRFVPGRVAHLLRQRMLPLAGIVEDLPDPGNQVTLDRHGRPRLRHRFGRYDLARGRRLGRHMGKLLRQAGAAVVIRKKMPSDEHVAHQCGTARFGSSPAHAALAPDCRLYGHDNVFVVDGSFLPTSLGVGPALTIVANALRVAAVAAGEL